VSACVGARHALCLVDRLSGCVGSFDCRQCLRKRVSSTVVGSLAGARKEASRPPWKGGARLHAGVGSPAMVRGLAVAHLGAEGSKRVAVTPWPSGCVLSACDPRRRLQRLPPSGRLPASLLPGRPLLAMAWESWDPARHPGHIDNRRKVYLRGLPSSFDENWLRGFLEGHGFWSFTVLTMQTHEDPSTVGPKKTS